MGLLLGVDAGGSKTLAVVADGRGIVRGVGLSGGGNFQGRGCDLETARNEVQRSMDAALARAGADRGEVEAAYFGMAGADREQDFELVKRLLDPICPFPHWDFENDVTIGLRAGTLDGVGVGVVCGSGTNVVGFNRSGKRVQVGGMGYLFGDYAGGTFISQQAIRRAMRGHEGRGRPTALYERLCEAYGLERLIDLVDRIYGAEDLELGRITPLVFETAARGDRVAREILRDVGEDLAVSALAATERLFKPGERVPVVAMGSVFQNAGYSLMYAAFRERLETSLDCVEITVLDCEPVFGAVYASLSLTGRGVSEEFRGRLQDSWPGRDAGG